MHLDLSELANNQVKRLSLIEALLPLLAQSV